MGDIRNIRNHEPTEPTDPTDAHDADHLADTLRRTSEDLRACTDTLNRLDKRGRAGDMISAERVTRVTDALGNLRDLLTRIDY